MKFQIGKFHDELTPNLFSLIYGVDAQHYARDKISRG